MQTKTGFPSSHQLKSYVAAEIRGALSCQLMLAFLFNFVLKLPVNSLFLFINACLPDAIL